MRWARTVRLHTIFAVVYLWLLSAPAWSQITVPSQVEVGQETVASVNATVPEGATFDGGWVVSCQTNPQCRVTHRDLREENTIGIWARDAGIYSVKFSGFWLLTKEVTFKDGDGNDVTIISYLGHGFINEEAAFEVTGGIPPDPPDPPDPPSGEMKVWFAMTAGARDNVPAYASSLTFRQKMESLGHDYQETIFQSTIDNPPSRLRTVAQAVRESPVQFPVVVLEPVDSSDAGEIRVLPLPDTGDELLEILK